MKVKVTQREVKQSHINVIAVGFCNLQNLLCCECERFYTVRREGWASDVYTFGNNAISTGYAPFGNIKANYKICKKYDDMAKKIWSNHSLTYEDQKVELRNLIDRFIDEVITK